MANIGVDIDEVLSETVKAFLDVYNVKHGTHFAFEEIYDYSFGKQFGLTPEEEIASIKEFFASDSFLNLSPVEGSQAAIQSLARKNNLLAVTSRPEQLKGATERWLNQHFNECFDEVILTNSHFDKTKTKSAVCVSRNLEVFIEDQIVFAQDCADVCKQVFLFDKPWNNMHITNDKIIRVRTWSQILRVLA